MFPKEDLPLLRGLRPSDYDHMALFLGCCFAWREKHQRQYYVRACLKNFYRMLDLNRHPLLHTTSRRSAPLGDPRGIPKLSRKFSLRKCYLRTGDRAITSVHNFKVEGSVNIFVASTNAKNIFFEVNIDIAKMSHLEEIDFSLSSFFDGILQELGDTVEFIIDEGSMPVLNDRELDFTSEFDMDFFKDINTPSSDVNDGSSPPTQVEDHTIVINIQNKIDMFWNQNELHAEAAVTPVTVMPGTSNSLLVSSQAQVEKEKRERIERDKNNKASKEYRRRKNAKLAAKEKELEVVEERNKELSAKAEALQDIVNELKSKLVSLLANERTGMKRNHEGDQFQNLRKKMK